MSDTKVSQQYDRLAAIYDQRWHTYLTNTLQFLKQWIAISKTDYILDVGCGTGYFEQLLLTENAQQSVVGVDISTEMLKIAKQKFSFHPNYQFHQTSVNNLPFDNGYFDLVVSASAFHYFEQPQIALLEMKRVVKPQGKIIILDWCRDYLSCRIFDYILKRFDSAYHQCYTQAELHQLLTLTSLKIERTETFKFGLIWGLMIVESIPN